MQAFHLLVLTLLFTTRAATFTDGGKKSDEEKGSSFRNTVLPLLQKSCLPCHAEGSSNPSELFLDSRESLMKGGKNGPAVVPGNSRSSILIQKLSPAPPFGDRMPLKRKRDPRDLSLTPEEIGMIANWIDHGAKDN
jgi:hypothetical protein